MFLVGVRTDDFDNDSSTGSLRDPLLLDRIVDSWCMALNIEKGKDKLCKRLEEQNANCNYKHNTDTVL